MQHISQPLAKVIQDCADKFMQSQRGKTVDRRALPLQGYPNPSTLVEEKSEIHCQKLV